MSAWNSSNFVNIAWAFKWILITCPVWIWIWIWMGVRYMKKCKKKFKKLNIVVFFQYVIFQWQFWDLETCVCYISRKDVPYRTETEWRYSKWYLSQDNTLQDGTMLYLERFLFSIVCSSSCFFSVWKGRTLALGLTWIHCVPWKDPFFVDTAGICFFLLGLTLLSAGLLWEIYFLLGMT